jgi:diketogulonate reductase-like aldo/keto reductase
MTNNAVTRRFGCSDAQTSTIGQGSWMIENASPVAAVAALQHGIDRGLTHIDTAEMYGNGAVERLVAQAIKGRRDEVFLVSKVLPTNASRSNTIRACEQSLQRLCTDHLDCYLLHWRGSIPLADTLGAFEHLQQQGKIKSFGVSNFDVDDLDEALSLVGPGKLACNQVLYHAEQRAIEHAVIPWCQRNDVAVVAYSPFGHDAFPSPQSKGGLVLAEIAARHHATSHQIVLAFLCRIPQVFTIPKALTLAHVAANAAAASLQLGADELAMLDNAFPRGRRPRHLPMI